jgi:DNA polymerase III delta prime subunit
MKDYSKNHHAHIVELNGQTLERAVLLVEEKIVLHHKNELCYSKKFLFNSLKIKQAKKISSATENKNASNERSIFLIGFNTATREAQNALLKTLEEPPHGTSFVLLVPTSDILLETIQSRCISLTLEHTPSSRHSFLGSSYKERLEHVKKLIENKELLDQFYTALEREIKELLSSYQGTPDEVRKLSLPFKYKKALMKHSPSSKYLLEEIALSLPLISNQ